MNHTHKTFLSCMSISPVSSLLQLSDVHIYCRLRHTTLVFPESLLFSYCKMDYTSAFSYIRRWCWNVTVGSYNPGFGIKRARGVTDLFSYSTMTLHCQSILYIVLVNPLLLPHRITAMKSGSKSEDKPVLRN